MSLLGTYTQVSGPTYALGAKLCTLSIAATSANLTHFERTWCDSTNTTIAQESWRVPTSASRGWFDGQRGSSRLWAAQVCTGGEYDVSAPRAARLLGPGVFERRSQMLASQRAFNQTERFTLSLTAQGLRMTVQSDAPLPLRPSASFKRRSTRPKVDELKVVFEGPLPMQMLVFILIL